MSEECFEIQKFLKLKGLELSKYAEPLLANVGCVVSETTALDLLSNVDQLSTEQLVYALELGMKIAPDKFAKLAIESLSHSDANLCCSAARVLEHMAPEVAPGNLRSEVERVPIVDIYLTHFQTGERFKVGTNGKFLAHLVKKLDANSERQ